MIIEHQFITRRPANEALERAEEFLGRVGFYRASAPDIGRGSHDSCREYERRQRTFAVEDATQLKQHLIIEYDRGRVTVAGLIHLLPKWGGRSALAFWVSDERLREKAGDPRRLMTSLVQELESVMANEHSVAFDTALDDAIGAYQKTEAAIRGARAAINVAAYIALGIGVLILVVALIFAFRSGFYGLFH